MRCGSRLLCEEVRSNPRVQRLVSNGSSARVRESATVKALLVQPAQEIELLVKLTEELTTADEHAVLTGGAPFESDQVFVFTSITGHFDCHIAHLK